MTAALLTTGVLLGSLLVLALLKKSTRHFLGHFLLHLVIHPMEHLWERFPRSFEWTAIIAGWLTVFAIFAALWFGAWLLVTHVSAYVAG